MDVERRKGSAKARSRSLTGRNKDGFERRLLHLFLSMNALHRGESFSIMDSRSHLPMGVLGQSLL